DSPPLQGGVRGGHLFDFQVGQSLYHSGKLSTYASGLNTIISKEAVFIHPDDAEPLGLVEGEIVNISLPVGAIQAPVAFSKRISRGTLFFPEHFSLEIKKGLPLTIDPSTHVPYGDRGVVTLSKISVAVSTKNLTIS
ncbi:MAG: hypothetical protein HY201_04950, partial [Nitrospirae bacterium]|nr:hypothetical protein [Candidatus Troglogloeales bacterium]